jgi:hypothetical protein
MAAKCIETLGRAGAAVDVKAPDDAAAFKAWLRQISQHVAEASKEGGLFSAGSGPVSGKEKATLQQILHPVTRTSSSPQREPRTSTTAKLPNLKLI